MSSRDLKRLVAVVVGCAIVGLGCGGALAFGVVSSVYMSAPSLEPERTTEPPAPSLTEGFSRPAPTRPSGPPVDPPWEPPSAGEDPEPPSEPVDVATVEADIEIGIGRAAVLELDVRPVAFRTHPYPLQITPLPPYIALSASRGGAFVLTVEHEGGEQQWTVSVHGSSLADPEGEGLVVASERLELPPGRSVVCGVDAGASFVVVDESTADVVPVGEGAVVVLSFAKAVADVVVAQPRRAPRVLTVDGTVEQVGALPGGCRAPPEPPLHLPAGGEMTVPTGIAIASLHVADDELVEATLADDAPGSVVLRPLRRGETTVAASDDRGGMWISRVTVD